MILRRFLYSVAVLSVLALAYLLWEYSSFTSQREAELNAVVVDTTDQLNRQIDAKLRQVMQETEALARELGSRDFTTAEIEARLRQTSLNVAEVQGVTAAYEPFAFSSERKLYAPYYSKSNQRIQLLEESYDYTDSAIPTANWYTRVRDTGASWIEPYYSAATDNWYVDYGVRFYYADGPRKGELRGTVTMSFICRGLSELIHAISLGKTGYGILLSKEGTFLSHPIDDYVGKQNIREIMARTPSPAIRDAFQQVIDQEQGSLRFADPARGGWRRICFRPIESTGWKLCLVFFESDLIQDRKALDRRHIHLALLASLVIVSLMAVYFNKDHLDEREIWQLSVAASLLLLANICLVGFIRYQSQRQVDGQSQPPITDLSALSIFERSQRELAAEAKTVPPTPVPTGLYLEQMEFQDNYNLNISGRLWQKYPLEIVDKVEIGIRLPQLSPFAESALIQETYREQIQEKEGQPGYLLVGYDLRATLRLNLEYGEFPFDQREIDIRIEPLQEISNLLLVPDLESYKYTNPSQKCGLSDRVSIPGSSVMRTYFTYTQEIKNANFGFGSGLPITRQATLHYRIDLRRALLNAFVTYLIPIVVTVTMIFLLLHACRKTTERQGIIESMAAFCFVLIFSHIDLRREIVASELVYIEYFYLTTYVMILLSTFNLVSFTLDKNSLFDFNGNQLYKAAYFPFFFLTILLVSLWKLY